VANDLKHLVSLTSLNLNQTGISDIGVAHLQGLKNLKEISFFQDPIMNNGLERLKDLTNLENLDLNATQVTPRGWTRRNCSSARSVTGT
jgi:Leucine-rich repeat (LRR) protein